MKLLRKILLIIFVVVLVGCVFVGLMGYNLYNSAVSRISLRDKVEEVRGDENFVVFSDLPDDLVNATIAVEDHRFREHGSIDLISIGRAMSANIKAKDAVEGGSTITQQVAKNLYFMTEKENISRKSAELILSYYWRKIILKMRFLSCMLILFIMGMGIMELRRRQMDI